MDINEIQALIKFVAKSGVSEVELETKGFKIVIKTPKTDQIMMQAPVQMLQAAQPMQTMAPQVQQAQAAQTATPAEAPANDESKYIAIKSPMIGTFYRSAGPDKPSFINVGDEVNLGKVICIIEAMKLFNEIESDIKGRIVKVLVDDGKPVEYDQVLFLVEPS
ncbi:MAG: acetyl-CoA carboxylase biotin carboxyl carrier protein [Bacteroidetes bacterium]|nr:acetyl-CoA carboxylase biotin carboxyl carrier protein [Bacteroidota bacterium]